MPSTRSQQSACARIHHWLGLFSGERTGTPPPTGHLASRSASISWAWRRNCHLWPCLQVSLRLPQNRFTGRLLLRAGEFGLGHGQIVLTRLAVILADVDVGRN